MADAGKIAPTYDGEWSANKTYDFHTYVTHNDNCYIAKQPSTGVEPTEEDNAYWFLALKNVSASVINNIINGTTAVGNALKLGGKLPSEYALDAYTLKNRTKSIATAPTEVICSMVDFTDNITIGDVTFPKYSKGIFISNGGDGALIGIDADGKLRGAFRNGQTWENPQTFATTADLANYLPLNVGGTQKIITGTTSVPIIFQNTNGENVGLQFIGKNGTLGYLGVYGKDNPAYITSDGATVRTLLHTGNKPSGTYTGNGSTTARTIATGGIGKALLIEGNTGTCLVFGMGGAIGVRGGDIKNYGATIADYANGVLTLATTEDMLNASGVTYKWQVL